MVTALRIQIFIFGIVVIGSLAAIVFADDRFFPFSNFPMYSRVFAPADRTEFWSVGAEFEDGSVRRFDTLVGNVAGMKPFWGASFREALLVNRDPQVLRGKLKAALDWQRRESQRLALTPQHTARKLILYRHDVPWSDVVELRLKNESVRQIYLDSARIVLEVQ